MKRLIILTTAALAVAVSSGCRCGGVRNWWNRTFYRGDACEPTCGMDGGAIIGQPTGEFPAALGGPGQPFVGPGFPAGQPGLPPGEIISSP